MATATPQHSGTRGRRLLAVFWFLTTLVLGTLGYLEWWGLDRSPASLLQAAYGTIQLFVLQTPGFDRSINWMLEAARWMAALFLGGTIWQVGRALLADEIASWKLRRLSGHTVITGLGRRGLACAEAERARDRTRGVVVIERDPDPAMVKALDRTGAHLVTGDASHPEVLEHAGIRRAATLYTLCPDDGINCEAVMQARAVRGRQPRTRPPLDCQVQISDLDLRVDLQRHGAERQDSATSVRFFDFFDQGARRILLHSLPLDHGGIAADNPRRPHLVVLGFGRMGRAVALRAAKLGHFANAARDPGLGLRISVIDREAQAREAALLFRYPGFPLAADLELHRLEIESGAASALLQRWCADLKSITTVVVCFDQERLAVETALRMRPWLATAGVRLAVRISRQEGLSRLVPVSADSDSGARIVRFGAMDRDWWEQSVAETREELLARVIHLRYVAERTAAGQPATDPALTSWHDLAEDLRESNRQQADHLPVKLRAIGGEIAPVSDPRPAMEQVPPSLVDTLAAMEHSRWNAERWLAGWEYAPGPKDVARKTSPWLVPWAELPEEIRDYDRTTVRLIPDLLAAAGHKAVRQQPV